MITKIYLFNNTHSSSRDYSYGWNTCYAMAETGEVLASHICSHIGYMFGDLYANRPERIDEWTKKFGEFEIVELDQDDHPPQEVFERNQKLRELAESKQA